MDWDGLTFAVYVGVCLGLGAGCYLAAWAQRDLFNLLWQMARSV